MGSRKRLQDFDNEDVVRMIVEHAATERKRGRTHAVIDNNEARCISAVLREANPWQVVGMFGVPIKPLVKGAWAINGFIVQKPGALL